MPYYDASKFGYDGVHGEPMGFHLFNSGIEDAVDHVKNYSDPEKIAANFPTIQSKDPDVVRETITRDLDITNKMLLGAWYHDKHKDDPNYDTLFSYAWLAKALEPSEVLETEPPNGSAKRSAWEQYANSVRGEFRSAHFSEGDVATLLENLTSMEKNTNDEEQSGARAGNF